MRMPTARRIAAASLVGALSFTLVACPSSDDEDTVQSSENESPDNESPENEQDNASEG